MKKLLVLLVALLLSIAANAAKLESDVITTNIDNCLVTIGNVVTDASIPATVTAGGKLCSYDLSTIQPGPYVSNMKAQIIDPVWGSVASDSSAPFSFTKPDLTVTAPIGLHLVP